MKQVYETWFIQQETAEAPIKNRKMPSPSVRKHLSEIDVTKSLDYNKEHFCVSIHFKTQNCTAHLFHNDFSQMKNSMDKMYKAK